MSGVDYLLTARVTLDELHDLVDRAAQAGQPVSEIAERAHALLQNARSVLDAFGDEQGTE